KFSFRLAKKSCHSKKPFANMNAVRGTSFPAERTCPARNAGQPRPPRQKRDHSDTGHGRGHVLSRNPSHFIFGYHSCRMLAKGGFLGRGTAGGICRSQRAALSPSSASLDVLLCRFRRLRREAAGGRRENGRRPPARWGTDGAPGSRARPTREHTVEVRRYIWPVVGIAAVAFSIWLLYHDLRGLSLDELWDSLMAISGRDWLLAIVATFVAYGALAAYDHLALLHLRRRVGWLYITIASFTTYALSHNIGASVFSGSVVRYRAYTAKGLSGAEVGILVAFCSFT